MANMTFDQWEWPANPEQFQIRGETSPQFTVSEDGSAVYAGMSPVARSFSGKGVFFGENAADHFKTMMKYLTEKTPGALVHPVWGGVRAVLTQLTMEEGSREECISYSFVFREVDAQGNVIVLPTYPILKVQQGTSAGTETEE